jgi:hypothetical protein
MKEDKAFLWWNAVLVMTSRAAVRMSQSQISEEIELKLKLLINRSYHKPSESANTV